MKNSVSDSYLSVESEEEDEYVYKGDIERNNEDDSDDSDSSSYSYNEHHSRTSSVSSAWPQTYRLCSFPYVDHILLFIY